MDMWSTTDDHDEDQGTEEQDTQSSEGSEED
jgi:hypothetical protein